ncbi:MAG TPA: hypothetical protein VLO07_07235, partial [Thermoanaerobaculia bacterium]|nr:hypothetical protein [Thermoanaerobaculia bacterium]
MTLTLRRALFTAAMAASLGVAFLVFLAIESHGLTAVWALSVIAFAMAAFDRRPGGGRRVHRPGTALLLVCVAAFPVLVRVLHMDQTRMHRDEFITAYFSATQDFQSSSFFDFMPEKSQWQAQFPKPFFFLQRVFFRLFGASTVTIRLSVQIYVALLSLTLFLIV